MNAAEVSAIIDVMLAVGIMKPHEFADLIAQTCQRADDTRRRQAMGDNG